MAELIRQSVDLFLKQEDPGSREARLKRAAAAVGRFASGKRDVSVNHDRYLADAYKS